jgi:hypothetical protein
VPKYIQQLISLSQRIMQPIAMGIILTLAALSIGWCSAAMLGLAPWLTVRLDLGDTAPVDAGPALQLFLALLIVGLCFFLPTNARVMALERTHRQFKVSMSDVARAYQAVHAADREGVFELHSEFDSVRDRLTYLHEHPDLRNLEPEILELAAQMSHQSRELAELYSMERVERARGFLRQRQEEAQLLEERVRTAQSVGQELRRWLERVEVEEAVVRAQMKRLEDDLEELLPLLGLGLTRDRPGPAAIAAE